MRSPEPCCGGSVPGKSETDPVLMGDPGGPTIRVEVIQPFYGLWAHTAVWVTGQDVDNYLNAGHIRRL